MGVTKEQLDSFHRFASEKLDNGASDLTLGDLLVQWHDAREQEEVRAAIRQGLTDIAAGRGRPANEVTEELRRKYRF